MAEQNKKRNFSKKGRIQNGNIGEIQDTANLYIDRLAKIEKNNYYWFSC